MASIELHALESRARWAYERARLGRAIVAFVPMLLIVGVAAWLGKRPVTVINLGLGIYAAGALLLWYGREPAKAVLPGVLAGLVPLCFSLCASHMGHVCTGDHCYALCVPACTAGGLGAGILVARFGLKQARGMWFWLFASGLALVTGSLGCSCVGYSGLIGLNLSYGLGLLPGVVKALRGRLGKSS
jgi:hypothetical protein